MISFASACRSMRSRALDGPRLAPGWVSRTVSATIAAQCTEATSSCPQAPARARKAQGSIEADARYPAALPPRESRRFGLAFEADRRRHELGARGIVERVDVHHRVRVSVDLAR